MYEDLAARLRDAEEPVRIVGGKTKIGWGGAGPDSLPEVSTLHLDRIVEHNEGDLTAVLQAGVPLAKAQEAFASANQMLALDPPDIGGATIGGVVAAGDSGPLRHRYGAARDLIVGITVALPDGTEVPYYFAIPTRADREGRFRVAFSITGTAPSRGPSGLRLVQDTHQIGEIFTTSLFCGACSILPWPR